MLEKFQNFLRSLNKRTALWLVFVVYVLAVAISILWIARMNMDNDILRVFWADILCTLLVFAFSYASNNSSAYDPYWSVIPVIIARYLIQINPDGNPVRQWLVFGLILFWSVRLTANWARGWRGFSQQDWRYSKLAEDTGRVYWLVSFTGIHMVPTLVVFLGCLPLFYIMASTNPVSIWEYIVALVVFAAVVLEWISDEQLRNFKKHGGAGLNMDRGLWSLSRHPNYLGEILYWLGLFLFVPAGNMGSSVYYTVIGFVSMVVLFRFISIPMMEKRNLRNKKGYEEYRKRVGMLVPKILVKNED